MTHPLLRRLLLWTLLLLPVLLTGCAHQTAAELAANDYASHELAAAPAHGNLPDYSLASDKLATAQHLATVRVTMHFAGEAWSILQFVLLLACGAVAAFRDLARRSARSRWVQCYLFLLLFTLATFVLDLPLALYSHHLSLRYGLSIQSWASWFADQAKSFAITWIVGGLLVMLLFAIIRRAPRRWWLVFWLAAIPLALLGIFLSPQVDKAFNHFEPLSLHHPELVAQLEQVAQRGHMNIPSDRMFLMQASAKVTTLNAYVTGFGASKRVVVWDTSLTRGTPDDVLFIFGHESGHYVLGHIRRGLLLGLAVLLLLLWLGYGFVQWAIARFGPRWRVPSQHDWAALAVLLLAFSIFSAILEPFAATYSRAQEHAADVYGQEAIHGLVPNPQATAQASFDVLGEASLADPNPSPFVEFWTFDHPAIGRRAAFAHAYNPWAKGMEPKYFGKSE